jgi:hypothetical protein
MRLVGEIPNDSCKITVFGWNNRYLIKFERGLYEQTYKINEFDVSGDQDIHKLVDQAFIDTVLQQFDAMEMAFKSSLHRNDI